MRPLFSTFAPLVAFASFASAQSAYLPAPGKLDASTLVSYQRARDFYALGDVRFTLPDPLEQHTARADLGYGLAESWALDASFGWSTVHYKESATLAPGLFLLENGKKRRSGLIDTRLGLRHTLVDEFASLSEATPTLTARAGAIIPGTYDTGFINAVGDGAAGVELGLHAAKTFAGTGSAVFGDLTWRGYAENVPDAVEAAVGVSQQVRSAVFTIGLRHLESLDGMDILGPGFTGIGSFSDVKEINTSLELGLSLPLGPVTAGLGFARTLTGENTPVKSVYSLALGASF